MRTTLALTMLCVASCDRRAIPAPAEVAGLADLAIADRTLADSVPAIWPKRVTLRRQGGEPGDSLRLVDGTVHGLVDDLTVQQAMVLSMRSSAPSSICAKGTFATLAEVPVDETDCPVSPLKTWAQIVYLSAAALHGPSQSSVIGLSMLVRDGSHTALYRLRMVSDSYELSGDLSSLTTATFDDEPAR